jgi:two-component system phosphate regulon sensor histidine kinase PhoR
LTIIDESFENEVQNMSSAERLQRIERMSTMDKARYETIFMDFAQTKPIQMRINNLELELLLRQELLLREIKIPFEFRVFDGNQVTDVGSENYLSALNESQFKTPLFIRDDETHRYELRLAFPNLDRFIEESVYNTFLLSLLFTFIIIVVFAASLFQIIKQKKISDIKSDFINNMTHEFKTPIATIHLALDALKNKDVFTDIKKSFGYLDMIREENKRLHTHVENVLQISQLEKQELDLAKEKIDPHNTIQNALDHVRLIIENRGGMLSQSFTSDPIKLLISPLHMTNVWVNLLDNAIKYSNDQLVVDVETFLDEKGFVVKIKDKGIGMSPAVRKRIFDKFYRESSGNVHNVKGHGLGLAYVKQILNMHSGTISVSSVPNQGSTFTVLLPLK